MNIKIPLFLAALFLGTLLCAQTPIKLQPEPKPAVEKGTKIAVIDAEKVYNGYYKRAEYENNLKTATQRAEAVMEKMDAERIKARRNYEKLREETSSFALSDSVRETRYIQANDAYNYWKRKEEECNVFQKTFLESQRESMQKMKNDIQADIVRAVKARALLEGYDLVLDASALSTTELPVVFYHTQKCDLTQKVIADLNQGQPTPTAPKVDRETDPVTRTGAQRKETSL